MSTATTPTSSTADQLRATREGLFFIVGCGRSGTTLLQSMLLSHPRITIPPETKFYGMVRDTHRGLDLSTERGYVEARDFAFESLNRRGIVFDRDRYLGFAGEAERTWPGIFTAVLAAYAATKGADRVGEKSPVHTHYAHEIMEDFPEAKFVHMLRDPRAVVLSRMKAGFGTNLIGPNIVRWRRAVDMHDRIADRLGPGRYHIVRYEDLVRDKESALRALCAFLGIDFVPEMLEHQDRKDRGWSDRSQDWLKNTLKPVFTSSIDAWKQKMKPAHIALVEASLGDRIERMGYERTGASTWLPGPRVALSILLGHAEEAWNKAVRGVRKALGKSRTEASESSEG
ncbi:MAG: sulfotransferase [Phycisphaeraceae bacterium]|nr:sulfotransferase [Phycisphaeraceae bacterium]